jgi:hypothetical protein
MSAVSGSAIRDGVDAGLLKTVVLVFYSNVRKVPQINMLVSRAQFVFGSGWLNLTPPPPLQG